MRRTSHAPNRQRVNEAPLGIWLPRCAIAEFGADAATILAGALVYMANRDPAATIVRADSEWLFAGLSRRQVQRGRAMLVDAGLIGYALVLNNGAPTPHYELDGDLHLEVQRLHLQVHSSSISKKVKTGGRVVGQQSVFVQPTRREYANEPVGCDQCDGGMVEHDTGWAQCPACNAVAS